MAAVTPIEWTDRTWNPVVGCSVTSPGCTNCYAMKMAARIERMFDGKTHYAGTTTPSKAGPVFNGKVALAPDHILTEPLRWRKPQKIFVNSMGDLFHENVPDGWVMRDNVSEATGYKRSSRDAYIQRLKVKRLVEIDHGDIRASELLFD